MLLPPSQRERWSIFTTFFCFLSGGAEVFEWAESSSPLLQILPPIVCGCLTVHIRRSISPTSRNSFPLLRIECEEGQKGGGERCECPSILGEGERYDRGGGEKRDISFDPIRELLGMQKGRRALSRRSVSQVLDTQQPWGISNGGRRLLRRTRGKSGVVREENKFLYVLNQLLNTEPI